MPTSVSLAKHPIHPMLVVFPIGIWSFSLICDLIGMSVATSGIWFTVTLYTIVGGLIGALAAAEPGLIDLLYYKGRTPPGKKTALTHMTINLTVVVLDAVNIWLRTSGQESMKVPLSFRASAYAWSPCRGGSVPNGACLRRGGEGRE